MVAAGEQIGREARAFMNVGNAWSTYWAPVVNLAREPRWGRNIETPGEDPYLSGEYATAFVRGFQEAPEAPGQLMASACCKHYVANEMEHSTVSGETWTRHDFDAQITPRDLVDSYMLPFQACVEKGHVSSLSTLAGALEPWTGTAPCRCSRAPPLTPGVNSVQLQCGQRQAKLRE